MERLEAPGMDDREVFLRNELRGLCKIGFLRVKVAPSRFGNVER